MLYSPFRYGDASERVIKFDADLWLRCSNHNRALQSVKLVGDEPLALTLAGTTIATLTPEHREYVFHTPIPCESIYFTPFTIHGAGCVVVVERPIVEEEGRDIRREIFNNFCVFPIFVDGRVWELVTGNGVGFVRSSVVNKKLHVLDPKTFPLYEL